MTEHYEGYTPFSMKTGLIACLLGTCFPLYAQPALNAEEVGALKQSYYRTVDEVRGLTFMMPKFGDFEHAGCYLIIGNPDDSKTKPSLFFRCVHVNSEVPFLQHVGNGLDNFDEVMFRVSNTTYTVKMTNFANVKFG